MQVIYNITKRACLWILC